MRCIQQKEFYYEFAKIGTEVLKVCFGNSSHVDSTEFRALTFGEVHSKRFSTASATNMRHNHQHIVFSHIKKDYFYEYLPCLLYSNCILLSWTSKLS